MGYVLVKQSFNCDASELWALICQFDKIHEYHELVKQSTYTSNGNYPYFNFDG